MIYPASPAAQTLHSLALDLSARRVSSRSLIEATINAIEEDPRAFTHVDAEAARAAADRSDRRRSDGAPLSSYDGVPISVKDVFDRIGQPTAAGSAVLRDAPPARSDAPTLERLTAAGLIIVGRTQMSEFAFTGLGLNPHAPPLPNPHDPTRVPGGSSSGAAVSVALRQACAAIRTDTGGSVRIPAAFCGLVGFKPTQRRITRQGALPLSTSLDSIGPIAQSVACCQALDALMADDPIPLHGSISPTRLRLGVPRAAVATDLEAAVGVAFDQALSRLSAAGVSVETVDFPQLDQIPGLSVNGSISNAEAFAWHRQHHFFNRRDLYDPNVLSRIEMGAGMSAADYIDLLTARAALIADAEKSAQACDAVVFPTTAVLAPRMEAVEDAAGFARLNSAVLRNPSAVNFLDRCAISLPMKIDGAVPCGLMLMGAVMDDAHLLAVALSLEGLVC